MEMSYTMKIAVTYENGGVHQHFGQTTHFKIYDVKGGMITDSMVVESLDCSIEATAVFLAQMHVSVLICGGIGGNARAMIEAGGIVLYGGVIGSADMAVEALLAGTLNYDPEIHRHSHEEEHACSHDCGHCHESCQPS